MSQVLVVYTSVVDGTLMTVVTATAMMMVVTATITMTVVTVTTLRIIAEGMKTSPFRPCDVDEEESTADGSLTR